MKNMYLIIGVFILLIGGIFTIQWSKSRAWMQTEPNSNDSQGVEYLMMDSGQTTYIDLTPADTKQLISDKPDLVIIDVSPNYNQGHLPGAINYRVGDGSLDKALPSLDKNHPYLVYCHSDSAAISGAKKMVEAGFTEVYRLEGNYRAWLGAGYEIEI